MRFGFKFSVFALGFAATSAGAEICDYRLSSLIGGATTGAVASIGGSAAATGIAGNALGFYTLTHAVTGATMLGSTAAGASAAGTVGIIAGTGSGLGAAGAALMSPLGVAVGVVVAVGVGASEGFCYFKDERITEYDDVVVIMRSLAENADPLYFSIIEPQTPLQGKATLKIGDGTGVFEDYEIAKLYIVNGTLLYRDRFKNSTVGNVGLQIKSATE